MADTGLRHGTDTYHYAPNSIPIPSGNLIDTDEGSDDSESQGYSFTGETDQWFVHTFEGDDLPAGAIVNGVEVFVKHRYINTYQALVTGVRLANTGYPRDSMPDADTTVAVAESLGEFSSYQEIDTPNNVLAESTYGGSTNDWGLTWSDWTDMSKLIVGVSVGPKTGSSGTWIVGVSYVKVKIHYTVPESGKAQSGVIGGTFKIKGGSVKIL